MQKFSIHSHSKFTDGDDTVEDMIKTAQSKGLDLYGISDHFIVNEKIKSIIEYDIQYYNFDGMVEKHEKHFEEIREIAKNYDIEVKCGLEIDFFNDDNWIKQFENFKRQITPDYLISGNHYFYNQDVSEVYSLFDLNLHNFLQHDETDMLKSYWKNNIAAVKSGYFDFLAHFDLIVNNPDYNPSSHKDIQNELLDVLIEEEMPIELNTKKFLKNNRFNPDGWMLKKLIDNNHPIFISDDSHRKENICNNFNEAEEYLTSLGHKNWWKPSF